MIYYYYFKDIDECASNHVYSLFGYNDCIIGAVCTNTNGSYNCNCPDGYIGDGRWFTSGCNGKQCCQMAKAVGECKLMSTLTDINECVTGMHNCASHEMCFNTQGSFRCDYTLNSDGKHVLVAIPLHTPCHNDYVLYAVQYLKFLNIFADDGELLQRVEPFSWSRAISPVYVDGGIPIGDRIESTVYVSVLLIVMNGSEYTFMTTLDQQKWLNIIWRGVAI